MAYSVDWITRVITIPTADLTLVSGTRYSLDMSDFLAEIRRLEWDPAEGLWAAAILDHSNTRFDFAGANYAPFDDIINGYTVQFTGAVTRVDLLGSNNDLIDQLIVTGVSVVPSNSAGLQIVTTGSGVLPADITAIAAAVWDSLISSHEIVGTYGEELATKSDLGAAASTTFYTPVTATIIEGVDVLGSAADINVRDGVYWQVDEDVATGMTMEYTFNLLNADERAGVFNSFGRYTGAPNSHYLELWAWNVESLSWEFLHDRFIDNTNSDSESSHSYYERHIDKALSNKVIIRIVHNVTGYSPNHEFHQDAIQLSSIDVTTITQQDKDDIENQIFNRIVETGYTFEELIRVIAAEAAGKIIQQLDGSYDIRDINDIKPRISGDDSANSGRDITAVDGT